MKKNLLTASSNLFTVLPQNSTRLLYVLLLVFCLGFSSQTQAQCTTGPYQYFESFKRPALSPFTSLMTPDGWSFNGTAAITVGGAAASARSGLNFVVFGAAPGAIGNNLVTPVFSNPSEIRFFYRSSSSTNCNFLVEWSTDGFSSVAGSSSGTTSGTAYQPFVLNTFGGAASVQLRITFTSVVSGSPSLFVDDFSSISTTPSLNTIVVPETGAAAATITCDPVNIPATGIYSFYDQGGASDNYIKNLTQVTHFAPLDGTSKVQITINAFAVDASTFVTVYDGSGTGGTQLVATTATVTTPLTVTSTTSSGLTVKFATNTTTNPVAANTGYDMTVKCVSAPTITSLGTSSGCLGTPLVINGANLSTPTAVTVGGVAVSSISSNTGTVMTVIPAAGSSGTVTVTTALGSATSVASYTVNALPTISAQPSSGTQTICLNGAATALTVTAAAGSGTISSYQWYSNTSATTVGATLVATNVSAATSDSYTPLTSSAGTLYYYVVVNNSNGCSLASSFTGAIAVNSPVAITVSPSSSAQTVCVGSAITALSVTATGGGLSYQWYSNAANSNSGGTLIGGATASTYTPSNASAMAATYYYCVVSNGAPCSSSATSAVSGAITVNAVPTAVTVSTAGTYCTSTTLTAANGGSGTIYWQNTTTGGTSTATPSSSQSVSSTGTYYFRAQSAAGCWSAEGSAVVTIVAAPGLPSVLAGSAITTTSFSANWNSVGGATGYYLDVATDVGFTAIVSGYNNLSVGNVTTYSVTGLTPGTTYYYRVRAYNGTCSGSSSGSVSCATNAITYCTPSAPATATTSVNNFSTSGGITNISNLGTGFTAGGYANYTAQSCSQYPSSAINYSITSLRTDSTDQTFFYYIWVDWNNNGSFADAGETIVATTTYQAGPFTGAFSVPSGQTAGSYRMRVSTSWVGANTSCAINGSGRGEMEDYTIVVVAVPPCASSTPSALTSGSITATGAVISWTDAAMTPNSIYDYYVNTTGTAPLVGTTPTGTVTGVNSVTLTGLTLGVPYYFWVRSNCGAPSAWVGSATFTTVNQDVVNMTNGSLTSCNVKFYDSAGSAANYANNESYTYTFYPASASTKLKVVFNSFRTESGWDGLSIYNGNSTAAPLISSGLPAGTNPPTCPAGSYYGTTSPGTIYSTAADGSLTFKFTSDSSFSYSGWDAIITCVTVPIISSFTPTGICSGATPTVTLTGVNFTGATSVKFNGVVAAYTVNSDTSITTTLPISATTGYITVSNAQATGTSTTVFSVNPIPATPNAGSDLPLCNGDSISLSGASSATSTSTVLSEDFNAGPWPSAWTRTLNGGYSPGDFRTSSEFVSGGNSWAGNGHTGYCSYFYSYLISNATSGDMITPAMDLSFYTASSLTFWIYNSAGTDVLKVYANNNNGAYTQVGSTYATYGAWTQITISLNAYAGTGFTAVRLKFTGTSDGGSSNIGIDDVLVTGSTTAGFVWSPSTALSATNVLNPTANPTSTITYTLTTSYATGCSSSDDVVVTVNPKPTVGISNPSASVCANSIQTVTATGTATTNTWTSSVAGTLFSDATASTAYVPGTNTATVYVKTPSTATITLTGSNGFCSNTATVTFTVVTKTWSGGLWNPAGPPSGTDNLVLSSNWSFGSLSGCSCTVTAGTIAFNSGETLSLQNGLNVSGGTVTFNEGSSLIQTNNVSNSGNITYVRNSKASFKYDYTYWSAPVNPITLASASPATSWDGLFQYNASIPAWQLAPASSNMSIGKGYIIRVPNTFNPAPAGPAAIHTVSFTGVPNNGTYTTPIYGGSNQLNLIGNPYPSAISAALFVQDVANSAIVDATIYFWTHNTALNASYQYSGTDYAVWNILGGTNTYPAPNPGLNNTTPNGSIGSGEGFFIKGLSTGVATFTNSMRTATPTSNTQFFRSTNATTNVGVDSLEKHRIWLSVFNAEGAYKQMLVGYVQGGTPGMDRGFDSEMVDIGNVVGLYTMVEDKKLSIQGKGLPFATSDLIPIGFKSTLDTGYTIGLSDFDGLFADQAIYLEDKALNIVHDLKQSAYTFATSAGTFEDRFVLRFTDAALGVPVFTEGAIVVYKNAEGLHINTGSVPMKSVVLYDVTGRLIASRTSIGSSETTFTTLPDTGQVLLVKITSQDGIVVTKKIIY